MKRRRKVFRYAGWIQWTKEEGGKEKKEKKKK
jgi:hypothetical protein